MLATFISRQREHYQAWWQAPIKRRHRVVGAMVGLFGGFWIGLLGRVLLGPLPAALGSVGGWAVIGLLFGALTGAKWPKVATLILFPFATFGGGS